MSRQESKKHLDLKIIREDIAALQPVFAWKAFAEPSEPKF